MYLFLLAFLYVITYIFWIVWFQKFAQKSIAFSLNFSHILMILWAYFGIIFCVFLIPDAELGNRIQHMIAGGCMIPFIAFLSYKKSWIHLSKFILFHIFFLITLGFWVGNELLESFFQLHYGYIFAKYCRYLVWSLGKYYWSAYWIFVFYVDFWL